MRLLVDHRRRLAEAARARGEPVAAMGPALGLRELKWLKPVYADDTIDYASEVIETRVSDSRPGFGLMTHPHDRHQPERRAGDLVRQHHLRRAPAGKAMTAAMAHRAPPSKTSAARMGVACGAHALHDGYTDLIYVMLPIWQAEFGLGYAALGLMKTVFSGTLAGFQIPAGLLAERFGAPLVLALGTALAGLGYCLAGFSTASRMLVAALFVGGLGASTQHPLASSLIAHAFAGARSLKALGTYNFAGDIGKMTVPAAAALLLMVLPWRQALALLGGARRAGGDRHLRADAALAHEIGAPAQKRRRGAAARPRARASAFRCCCRSA